MAFSGFDFLGHQVNIQVTETAGGWGWSYTIDDDKHAIIDGPACWSERQALGEAEICAANDIRSMCDPGWVISTGFSRLNA